MLEWWVAVTEIWHKFGFQVCLFGIMAGVIVKWIIAPFVIGYHASHKRAACQIDRIYDSIQHPEKTDKEGRPILHTRYELLVKMEDIYSVLKEHCGAANCPVVAVFKRDFDIVRKELEEHVHTIDESRAELAKQAALFEKEIGAERDQARQNMITYVQSAVDARSATLEEIKSIFDKLDGLVTTSLDRHIELVEKMVAPGGQKRQRHDT